MQKNLILSLLLLCIFIPKNWVHAQAVDWSINSPGMGIDVATDNFGNTFNCMQIIGSVVMGSNTLTSNGVQDVIVSKYSPTGNLLWATSFGGAGGDYANSVVYDNQGSVWVTGQFSGTMTVGSFTLTGAGGTDAYLVKLNAVNGAVLFAARGGSTGNDVGMSVKALPNGTLYWSGTYTSSFTFGTNTITGSGMDVFLLQLNNSGAVNWSKNITGSNIETMWTMNIDPSGNAYIGGFATSANTSYAGSATVNMSPSTHFVTKFDNSGNYVWSANSDFNGEIYGVSIDAAGSVYFTGNFDTQITLGSITLTNSGANDDILLVKLNSAGQYCWAKNFGSTGSDQGYNLFSDPSGNLFLTGSFQSTFSFGGVNVNGGGNGMAYAAKLDSAGTVIWVIQANSSNLSYAKGIYWFGPDDIYMAGIGSGTITFGNSVVNMTNGSGFLTKIADHANIIEGTVFRDFNNDGVLNTGETGVPNTIMQLNTGPYVSSSNNNGIYQLFTAAGSYSASIPSLPLYHTLSTAPSQTATFVGMGNIDTANHFGLYPAPNVNDLRVTVTPISRPKAGFVLHYMITCTNVGTTTQNAILNFTGDAILSYLQASPTHSSQSGSTYTWNLGGLAPQATTSVNVMFNVPTNAMIGDSIQSLAQITPVTNDTVPSDNLENNLCFVVGPYDPNFKEVSDSSLTIAELAQNPWLTYTVHFQNIGNDSAHTVVIRDSLSQNLDLTTLQIVAQSHTMNFQLNGNGKAEFTFPGIMLPDSMTNPITSCGFVKYRVKPKSTLVAGDSIPNYADIYFDYNPPITTDLVTTHILNPVSNETDWESSFMELYPNPAENTLWVKIPELVGGAYTVKIFATNGKEIKSVEGTLSGNSMLTLSISDLPVGVYFIQLKGENIFKAGRFVKK